MKKFIAASAVAAAAVGSVFGVTGHASAQTACVAVAAGFELPAPPVALPVGLPISPPSSFALSQCFPPDLPPAPGVPSLPISPPALP